MRRLFVLLLALLLPLQFAWAGAAAYCQHEGDTARAVHVGHHDHVHQGKASDGKSLTDVDCNVCNAAVTPLMLAAPLAQALPSMPATLRGHDAPPLPSAHTRAPDRPQWLRLA